MKHLLFVAGFVVAAGAAAVSSAGAGDGPLSPELQPVRAAVARYHSLEQAERAGYSIRAGEPCVASPAGTMGVHAVNPPLMADDAIDPLQPEILLYLPNGSGAFKLVGVEYWKRDADQDLTTASDRPSLLGQSFQGPMPGHNPTMPVHYDLHAWVAEENAGDAFEMFNAALACPS
jgi:hypothetical protein